MKYSNRSVLSRFGQEHSLSIQESHMHAGTFQSTATLTLEHPKRTSRYWVFGAVIVTSILAGCASRTTHAPVTDMSGGSIAPAAGGTYVVRSEEHTSELQSLMRNSYAVLV